MLDLNKKEEKINKPVVFIKKAVVHIGTFFLTVTIFMVLLSPIMPQPQVALAGYNEVEEQYTTTLSTYEALKTEYENKIEELDSKKEELLQSIESKTNRIDSLNSQIEEVNK